MAQGTVHVDESGAAPNIDISIINEKSVAVSIFRLEPNTFEEERVPEVGSGMSSMSSPGRDQRSESFHELSLLCIVSSVT